MRSLLLISLLFATALPAWGMNIQAKALLKGMAVLDVDGQQYTLKVGKRSPEGILLVSSTPKLAVIDVNGQRRQLTLSTLITSTYNPTVKTEVAIPRNNNRQYITNANINGRRTQVLVDTGANSVAMSSQDARRLGVNYKEGEPGRVVTASGEANAYRVKLSSISVGGITVQNVNASVVEGDYPEMVLLGMTYLEHVDMREQNGSLILQAKF
ncbi:TIGR02281 family clan AA aspartic protease [Oceanicoccus sp. KOV_DT_Chl]|uniref:retropepsin-like aspartic protease family protein n=1 Tax=Oceanicoccus sp. KOV_DT_Chl TaxID=1904639 RepID=UPI001F231AAF|nr:TIGR02281 family clan AA aspartic protease [Oceanicoccus sp. KOV_DT_Chl]